MSRIVAEHPQQADQQGRAGRPIDVVVTVDRDVFMGQHRLGEPLGRRVHVAELGRIGQEFAERRRAVPRQVVGGHSAREQDLIDQADLEIPGETAAIQPRADVHVAASPAPGAARKRAVDSKYARCL